MSKSSCPPALHTLRNTGRGKQDETFLCFGSVGSYTVEVNMEIKILMIPHSCLEKH